MNNQRIAIAAHLFALSFTAILAQADEGLREYHPIPFELEPVTDRILPADLDGDGLQDLLTARETTISVYFQRADQRAFHFSSPDATLELPGRATGWSLDNLPGKMETAGKRLVALVDGQELLSWSVKDRRFQKAGTVLDSLSGLLPSGAYPLDFVRDINGDGLSDIIVPGPSELQLYLQNPSGGYGEPVSIQSRMMNYTRLLPGDNLDSRVGQSVRIPQMLIRDVNNDQRPDLVASSEERIDVFLAQDGGRLGTSASYSINLRELEEKVGEVDFDAVDFSNLSGLLAHTYDIQLEDVDGDQIEDLMVREGGKLTLFGGTATGMNLEKPRQILKSSGNVLGTLLLDEDEDGLKDLWLTRIENVSLANVFLWLAVSGSVDVETFIYKNQGQRFASRPHRKITVDLKFPPILRSVDLVTTALNPEQNTDVPRSARAQLDAPDSAWELVVLRREAIDVFMNTISDEDANLLFGLPDYSRSKDRYVLDLGQVIENPARGANGDLQAVNGREADFEIAYSMDAKKNQDFDFSAMDVMAWEINNDGRDDFFVLMDRDGERVSGVLLLSK